MKRATLFVTGALLGALGVRAPVRACKPVGPIPFTITPSSTDVVPPTLPPIPAPIIQRADGSSQEGCGSKCGDVGSVAIAALATDDVSVPPGYRFTLAAGALPAGFTLPTFPLAPSGDHVVLQGATGEDDAAFDYTLQVVAVDGAGNESAPQMVRVHDDPGGCAIAHPRAPYGVPLLFVVAALLVAVRRRRRS